MLKTPRQGGSSGFGLRNPLFRNATCVDDKNMSQISIRSYAKNCHKCESTTSHSIPERVITLEQKSGPNRPTTSL
jgi:hypothetical protein